MSSIGVTFLKMDPEELFSMFDSFTDILIEDKEKSIENDSSVFDFLEETIRELAGGEEIILSNVNETIIYIIKTFMDSFSLDFKQRTYRFSFENIFAEGYYESILPEKKEG